MGTAPYYEDELPTNDERPTERFEFEKKKYDHVMGTSGLVQVQGLVVRLMKNEMLYQNELIRMNFFGKMPTHADLVGHACHCLGA